MAADSAFVVFLLVSFLLTVKGSELNFTSSATTLQTPITKNITIRCALSDSPSPSHNIVGRDLSYLATRDVTNTAVHDATHSDVDVTYVNSIIVTRNGVDIASISEHVAAQALGNNDHLTVTGAISSTGAVKGYIQLQWQYPKSDDAGVYQCDVSGVDRKGHIFTFSGTLQIMAADVTVSSLASKVGSLEQLNDLMKSQMNSMKSQMQWMAAQMNLTNSQMENMKNQMTMMSGQISQLESARYSGSPCNATDTCTGNLQCVDGQCACPDGQFLADVDRCAPQNHLGERCTSSAQCSGCRVQCVQGVCVCEDGYTQGLNTCLSYYLFSDYLHANSSTQVITSPGYPGYYVDNLDIGHEIIAPSGQRVSVTFTHVDLGSGYDYVDVFDGYDTSGTKLARVTYHGGSYVSQSLTSSGRYLFLHFHTDGAAVRTGFRATFTAVH